MDSGITIKMIKRIAVTGLLRGLKKDSTAGHDAFREMLDDPGASDEFDEPTLAALRDLLRAQEFYLEEVSRILRALEIK